MNSSLLATLVVIAFTFGETCGTQASPVTFGQFVKTRAGNNYTFYNDGHGVGSFNSIGQVYFSFLQEPFQQRIC